MNKQAQGYMNAVLNVTVSVQSVRPCPTQPLLRAPTRRTAWPQPALLDSILTEPAPVCAPRSDRRSVVQGIAKHNTVPKTSCAAYLWHS